MSNEIEVTVCGWVGTHPRLIEGNGGTRILNLRLGSTPRRRDPVTGSWGDGPTQWFTVVAFRDLAANAALSLHKGDPVLVRGRLSMREWEHEGRPYWAAEIVADAIGPDLSRGAAFFTRTVRRNGDGGRDEWVGGRGVDAEAASFDAGDPGEGRPEPDEGPTANGRPDAGDERDAAGEDGQFRDAVVDLAPVSEATG